ERAQRKGPEKRPREKAQRKGKKRTLGAPREAHCIEAQPLDGRLAQWQEQAGAAAVEVAAAWEWLAKGCDAQAPCGPRDPRAPIADVGPPAARASHPRPLEKPRHRTIEGGVRALRTLRTITESHSVSVRPSDSGRKDSDFGRTVVARMA